MVCLKKQLPQRPSFPFEFGDLLHPDRDRVQVARRIAIAIGRADLSVDDYKAGEGRVEFAEIAI